MTSHSAAVQGEQAEDLELLPGQVDPHGAARRLTFSKSDFDVAEAHNGASLASDIVPAQANSNAREQFADSEWLGHVLVCADLQLLDLADMIALPPTSP